jgi:short-subunit dehydrogenase
MQANDFLPEVVFLNAGLDVDDAYPHLSLTLADEILRTNIQGALIWVSALLEPFMERGSGQFVAISSLFAWWPEKASVAYSASKAGLSMLFRGLRIRYPDSGISFKTVFLGPIDAQTDPESSKRSKPERKSLLAGTGQGLARYLKRILSSRRRDFYYPYYMPFIFYFLRWLPDTLFEALTGKLRR